MIRPALVSLVGQDVQEQLQSLLILETLSDVEGAEHHHSPAGNEGLATLLTANYGGQNLVSVVYEHCVVLKWWYFSKTSKISSIPRTPRYRSSLWWSAAPGCWRGRWRSSWSPRPPQSKPGLRGPLTDRTLVDSLRELPRGRCSIIQESLIVKFYSLQSYLLY